MSDPMVVLTAQIGDGPDRVKEPSVVAPGVRYLCLTDRRPAGRPASAWTFVPVAPTREPVFAARRAKILAHATAAPHDYLWIDAAFRLDVDPRALLPLLGDADLAAFPHPTQANLAEEAQAIARRGLAGPEALSRQRAAYAAAGYPDGRLASTGFLLRRAGGRTSAFNVAWWDELVRWGHTRDQMSFGYCAWKAGLRVAQLRGVYTANAYAAWFKDR